jgi:hypothetical protein
MKEGVKGGQEEQQEYILHLDEVRSRVREERQDMWVKEEGRDGCRRGKTVFHEGRSTGGGGEVEVEMCG